MRKPKIWRVRVLHKLEDWISVEAPSAEEAETSAANLPNVVHVFPRSAIMATPKGAEVVRIGVDESDE